MILLKIITDQNTAVKPKWAQIPSIGTDTPEEVIIWTFFIGPRSDHSLPMSVTHWLTHDLVEDLMNWPKCAHFADYVDYVDIAEYA